MPPITKLLRPHHWIKNLFIFLPLFFSHGFENATDLINCVSSFVGFSLIASSIYILNDIKDRESDRLHHLKCKRPIANGTISVPKALFVSTTSLVLGISIIFALKNNIVLALALTYFILNICYTYKIKQFAIADVLIIAIGFVIRILIGGSAVNVELSHWIVIMTFLLALFLGFAKRRDDVLMYTTTGVKGRGNIVRYNELFINLTLVMTSTIVIIAYIMYCVSEEVVERFNNNYVYITAVFVVIGILRYLQLTLVDNISGNPTKILLRDRALQLTIIAWVLCFTYIIYF